MNLLNYKQDKVAVPDKEMLLVKDQYLYEINGLDMGKSVVLYKKELEIFKPMPKGDYKIIYQENNQYIQVTNEDIFKDYYAIQVVSITKLISSMYEPQGDIDVNIVLHELNNVITDMHGIVDYIKKVNFVVDSTKSTNVFPDLPIGSTVIRLEDGTLGAIPVSDMYEHFDRLTERIYNTVTGWLETDHQKFIQEMKEYKDELEKALKELSDELASDLQVLFNQKLEEFKQHIDNDLKPILLEYVNEVLKPELKSYVETLKAELNTYTTVTLFGKLDTKTIECINKIEAKCNECISKLNTHTENKKKELDAKTEKLKGDLNTHSEVKKQEISTHAIEVKSNLVAEITKEGTKQKTEVIETGDRVREEIEGLIPDNLGIRVEQLEKDRVLKSGDTMTGTLNINMEGKDKVVLKSRDVIDGVVGSDTDGVIVENSKSGKSIRLDNDGVGIYPSTSLKTEAKDLSEAVNELLDNKLDKGTYSGNASNLKTEIDGKVSKSGGALSGSISIRNDTNPVVNFGTATGSYQGFVGRQPTSIRLYNKISNKHISLEDDGSGVFHATNLNTTSKEVIGAINELNDNKLDKGTYSGNASNLKTEIDGKVSKSGGTITGATDVQGTFSANSLYSRGTIVSVGAITSSDNVTAYSDKRLKKNIRPLHDCLELISKLDVYRYDWKENGKKDIGVIAQEVEEVFPEFVIEVQDETKGTVKTVDYAKLATISLKGIKELVGMISELRDDIKQLKEEVNGKTQNR